MNILVTPCDCDIPVFMILCLVIGDLSNGPCITATKATVFSVMLFLHYVIIQGHSVFYFIVGLYNSPS